MADITHTNFNTYTAANAETYTPSTINHMTSIHVIPTAVGTIATAEIVQSNPAVTEPIWETTVAANTGTVDFQQELLLGPGKTYTFNLSNCVLKMYRSS